MSADIAACHECGGHYARRHEEHTLCPQCYRWDRMLRGLDLVKRAPATVDRPKPRKDGE
jgi:hypothetical protein